MRRRRARVNMLGRRTGVMVVLFVCGALFGCRHRPVIVSLSKAQTPNELVPPVVTNLQPMRSSDLPAIVTNAKPPVAEEVRPKKKTKRPVTTPSAPATAPAPAPAPDAAPVETAKLGELVSGVDANPHRQQEIASKIAAIEKRVSGLPPAVADREQKQISKVKLFLKEASDALKGGDVEGAMILATKADLLVDDVQK